MLAFILRRLGQAILVMLAVGLIAFSLFASSATRCCSCSAKDAPTSSAQVRATSA
jgi:ABC-type dipeptide/oligopeptide/nickel transport system permease component